MFKSYPELKDYQKAF